MKRKAVNIVFILLLTIILPLFGKDNQQQKEYKQAIVFEKAGEYAKAESLFVDLYVSNPNNFNYYNRYRNILVLQRKFAELQPVIEKRLEGRSHDRYLKLELGMLYYAIDNKAKANKIWTEVFTGQKSNIRNSYAVTVYQDAIEYRMGNEFHIITDMLRSITNDPKLLINYNFTVALRYRNWDHAVEEIQHILETDVKGLRYVRQNIFRYDPLSALYPKTIHALEKTKSPEGIVLLSDIYIHLQEHDKAFEVLNGNMDKLHIQTAMKSFAQRMFKQEQYELAIKAADIAESYLVSENVARQSMALLSAQAKEQLFYELAEQKDIISHPYDSDFLRINFLPFDNELAPMIESAYEKFDSLSYFPGLSGETAALHHAGIAYRVYQDFDGSLREYSKLAVRKNINNKSGMISKSSKLMLAKGEYDRALKFIQTAPEEYALMVHEEDQLLSAEFYISVISGKKDSIIERMENVLAMLPLDDPKYNDMLAFAAVVKKVMQDSLHYDDWLEAERHILMNNTASAIDIYKNLLDQDLKAVQIYALRYLDCLKVQRDREAELEFWNKYDDILFQSDMSDYFMLLYAGFMEKMQKFDIAYEIFEKYLLSYQESMYYENIREYVREHYSLGAP